jgi:prepilin-type N-terminal cleavage/methylation domain-containing protein
MKYAFTLIELLVSIILFSLLLVTVLYSFSFVSINMRHINNSNPQEAINYDLLRKALNSIYHYVDVDVDSNFFYYFKGNKNICRFITSSPMFSEGIGLGELRYENEKLLYFEGKIFDKNIDYTKLDEIPLTKSFTMLKNVKKLKFKYIFNNHEYSEFAKSIPILIKIKFIKNQSEEQYMFNIKSKNSQFLEIIQTASRVI